MIGASIQIPFGHHAMKPDNASVELSKAAEYTVRDAAVKSSISDLSALLPKADPSAPEAFMCRYVDFFAFAALSGLTARLSEHSSVAGDVPTRVLDFLVARVSHLGRSDVFVPIDTAVRPQDIAQAWVCAQRHRSGAIVAMDDDDDRPISDEAGQRPGADVMGSLCAQCLRTEAVGMPVSSNAAPQLTGSPPRDSVMTIVVLLAQSRHTGAPLYLESINIKQRFNTSDRVQHTSSEASRQLIEEVTDGGALTPWLLTLGFDPIVFPDTTGGSRLAFASSDIVHRRPCGNAPEGRSYTEKGNSKAAAQFCNGCLDCVQESRAVGKGAQ
jgi:phosphomannomutase